MLKRQMSLILIAIFVVAMAIPATAQNTTPPPTGGLTVPVSGVAQGVGRVTGTFTIVQFVQLANGLGAEGKFVLTTPKGDTLVTTATVPVAAATRAATAAATNAATGPSIQQVTDVCQVLELTIQPIDLNLLGLQVHLDTVHLVINADPTGGLLGNLLAGLLCGSAGGTLSGLLTNLVANLNQIVTILNGILAILG